VIVCLSELFGFVSSKFISTSMKASLRQGQGSRLHNEIAGIFKPPFRSFLWQATPDSIRKASLREGSIYFTKR
jgi:hypothetical protein